MTRSNVPRVRLYIDGSGLDDAQEQFRGIADRAMDSKLVMRAIQALMVDSSIEQFESGGDSVGDPWTPDVTEWTERKAAKGESAKTFERHGDLHSAMIAKTSGGKGAIRRVSKHSTTVGVRLYYAVFAGRKRRRLLTMTVPQQERYATMMIDYILEGTIAK